MSWEGSMHSTWVWSTRQGGGGCGCCPYHPHPQSPTTRTYRPWRQVNVLGLLTPYRRHSQPPSQHKSDLCTAKITFTTYIHVHFTAQDYNRPHNWTLNKRSCKNVGYVYIGGLYIFVYIGGLYIFVYIGGFVLKLNSWHYVSNLLYSRRVQKWSELIKEEIISK